MNTEAILEKMSLMIVDISLWHGWKTINKDDLADFGIDVANLPKKTVATLGTREIVTPVSLKVFNALKREALKLCLNNGVRFVGDGYAVPRAIVPELSLKLKQLKSEFESAKESFLAGYEEDVKQWITRNRSEWISLIGIAVNSKPQVDKAITFNYAVLDVMVPAETEDHALEGKLIELYGQLCHDIRQTARQAYIVSFVDKIEVGNRALRPIKAIRSKLAGLMFLHPSIAETIDAIDTTLSKLPKTGAIKGSPLNMVSDLLERQLANMGRMPLDEAEGDDGPGKIILPEKITTPETAGKVAPIAWDF